MKTSTFFALALTATGVIAEPAVAHPPTKVRRDVAAVTSVVAQVSAAISKLDTSVKAFDGSDLSGVQTGAQGLVSALTSGASALTSGGGQLSLSDALGLQDVVSPLGPAAQGLVKDISDKKSQFEQAGACTIVGGAVQNAGSAAKSLVDGVVAQVPDAAKSIAQQLAGKVVDTLTSLAGEFASDKCKNAGGSSATSVAAVASTPAAAVSASASMAQSSATESLVAPESAKEVSGGSAMTVTVTAPCACSSSSSSSSSSAAVFFTPTQGSNSTTLPTGTGGLPNKPSPTQPFVTAAAVTHGMSSGLVGFVAAVAAMLFI